MSYNLVQKVINDTNILLTDKPINELIYDPLEITNNKTYSFDLTEYIPSFTDGTDGTIDEKRYGW